MLNQTYDLSLLPGAAPLRVPASQYDSGRSLQFRLYAGAAAFGVPAGAMVTLEGTKPDGRGFAVTAAYSGSEVTADVTSQMTAVAGDVLCQLTITLGQEILGSGNFILSVEPAALPGDADLSDSDFSVLREAISAAAAASAKADKTPPAAPGNVALLDESGNLLDSGKALSPASIGALPMDASGISAATEEELNTALTAAYQSMENGTGRVLPAWDTSGNIWGGGSCLCRLYRATEDYGLAELGGYMFGGSRLQKNRWGGSWNPLEWDNPPMEEGVEYRTTERHKGKPVYRKFINCGPIQDEARVEVGHPILRHQGQIAEIPLPVGAITGYYARSESRSATSITLCTDSVSDGYGKWDGNWYEQVWYTK